MVKQPDVPPAELIGLPVCLTLHNSWAGIDPSSLYCDIIECTYILEPVNPTIRYELSTLVVSQYSKLTDIFYLSTVYTKYE